MLLVSIGPISGIGMALLPDSQERKVPPEFFFYGGLGFHGYNDCPWHGYHRIDRVDHYYPTVFDSALTVWRGNIISLKVYDGGRESKITTQNINS